MKVEVKNFTLQELIKKIELGDIQLPEFQRDYVWKQTDQKALLESIFYGYPIGSLLLLELDDKKPMFAWSMLKNIVITDPKKIYEKGKKKIKSWGVEKKEVEANECKASLRVWANLPVEGNVYASKFQDSISSVTLNESKNMQTTEEMLQFIFSYLPYQTGDENLNLNPE